MKRKFFQILMMVAVTVTLGVFVSCKDTNEDLYRDLDLRLQKIEGSATVPEAVQKQLDNMQKQLDLYKLKLDSIKSCECDCATMAQLIKDMQQAIADLQAAQVDPATWASMQDAIKTLTDNYATIYNFVTNVGVSKDELAEAVKMLEDKIAEIIKVPYRFAPAHLNRQHASAVASLGAIYFANGESMLELMDVFAFNNSNTIA